jgi:DNA-binding response OmpR family regulator
MCPHCGWDFETDTPIVTGGWLLTPSRAAIDGKTLDLTPSQAGVLYAIATGAGRPVTRDALLNRISNRENPNIVAVHVSRLRAKLGERFPIRVVRGHGLAWGAAA